MGKRSNGCFVVDFMSASSGVTGSCTYFTVRYPDHRVEHFIVDCGLYQERKYDNLNSEVLFDPKKLDFAIVTHNHIDHIGKLPLLVKNGYKRPIYTTLDTQTLMSPALYDTASIFIGDSKKVGLKPLYGDDDVSRTLELTNGCSYDEPIKVSPNITATFFRNGHLIGAAIILIQIKYYMEEPINILITGDYKSKNSFFDVPDLPRWVKELSLNIICESTYGYVNSEEVIYDFNNNVRTFFSNGQSGTLLLPVLSLGRAQLILQRLRDLQMDGYLNDVPIYLDGTLTLEYTKLYLSDKLEIADYAKNFLPLNLKFVSKPLRKQLLGTPGRRIIVTSSGMGTHGPAHTYIQQFIKRDDALIHFTCYCAEGTIGQQIAKSDDNKIVLPSGLVMFRKADVKFTSEFSSHAKKDELLTFLKEFKHPKLVCITHGEAEVKEEFAKIVLEQIPTDNVSVLSRDYYFRIKSTGEIESHTTHFCY